MSDWLRQLLYCLLTSFPNESLVFFGLILSGLIGSRLLGQSSFRSFDLLALLIITLEMAVGLIPDTFAQIELPVLFAQYMQILILVPVLLFYFAPNPDHQKQGRSQVDLMHGLLAATLLGTVMLGGIVINLLIRGRLYRWFVADCFYRRDPDHRHKLVLESGGGAFRHRGVMESLCDDHRRPI